ncbi:hypothetical protein [Streptomyces sp. NPDC058872]|uniref:hypothetical protein n=1 Tax=Streptomyces sp. NPDC058872 TaxID=3346661 RepID=UPI0036BFA475
MTPADELRAAEERLRMGDHRIDINLRNHLRTLLDTAADTVTAYPELGDDHDRDTCDDYACDLIGATLDLARALNGDPT